MCSRWKTSDASSTGVRSAGSSRSMATLESLPRIGYDVPFTSMAEQHVPRILTAPLSFRILLCLLSTADSPWSTPRNVALGFSAVMIYCQRILEMSNFTPITIFTV